MSGDAALLARSCQSVVLGELRGQCREGRAAASISMVASLFIGHLRLAAIPSPGAKLVTVKATSRLEVVKMARTRKSSSGARASKRGAISKPRSRRATAAKASSTSSRATVASNGSGAFVCPECGRSFSRAAALGAHRNRAHGVAGQSATARQNRSGRQGVTTRRARVGADGRSRLNRDQLLQALFPNGVPPREDVIRSVNHWLDEAERLVRLR